MSLKRKATKGIMWTFFEMFGGQVINFFVNIILARQLFPEDYGLLGMIFIFITLSNTLMDSGLSISILRMKNPSDEDFSTLFVSNTVLSVVIYAVLFIAAPFIAEFYNKDIITDLIRVYALTIVIQSFVQVQSVYLIKKLNFKKQALMKLPSIIISSAVAIIMAYNGLGVWSLVFMYLLQNFFWALFHWVFGDWNPKLKFNKHIFKNHFGFGYRLTIVELMNNVTANIYQIIIGKFYNPNLVGYYTQSLTLRQAPTSNIYGAMLKVLFPIFAEIQNDKRRLTEYFYKCQELLMLILFPVFVIFIFNAEAILVLLFSYKWADAAIYLQILSAAGLFNILVSWYLTIIKIISHSKRILRLELYRRIILFSLIGFSLLLHQNIIYLLLTIPLFHLIGYLIYCSVFAKLLKQSIWTGIKDVLFFLCISLIPAVLSYLITGLFMSSKNMVLHISINISLFLLLYAIIGFTFKKPLILFLLSILKRKQENDIN